MYIQEVKVERDKFKTHCNSLLELLSKYEFALTNVGRQFTEMKKKGRFIIIYSLRGMHDGFMIIEKNRSYNYIRRKITYSWISNLVVF